MGLARFLKLLAMPQRIDAEQLHRLLLYWRRKRKDEKNKNDPDFGTSVFSEYSVILNSGMVNTAKNNKVTFPKSSAAVSSDTAALLYCFWQRSGRKGLRVAAYSPYSAM